MEEPAPRRMRVAEFIDWDDGTNTRYELVHGVPFATSPPLARHMVVGANLFHALEARLRPPCRAFIGGGDVPLPALGLTLPLDEIYAEA
jgi:hypothetical protein